ncbi:MAG TPA: tripartite tricarboxylate transporter substrate binding protein [Pseudolabrys sp.]|nr:tripartite tricarboxylate transporter substrate binding protein [Pseudolabrys sp.]
MKLVRTVLLFALSLLLPIAGAAAQGAYPDKPVKIVVPFSGGSNTDILARILSDKLSAMWHQPVVVENKPGIAGTISAAHSAPDGYTLMLTSNGHTILNVLNKDIGIDAIKSFTGVAEVASVPMLLVVTPNFQAATLKDFIAQAKANPGKFGFASAGLASSAFIAAELLKQTAGLQIVHVPYRGTPEQMTSVMRGDTQLAMAFLGTGVPFIKAGQVRAVAIAAKARHPSLPDVPTFAEAGLPQYQYDSWFGVLAPAGTPEPIVKKVADDIATVMKEADVHKRLDTLGAVPLVTTPAEFDAAIKSDAERYGALLKAAGVTGK